MNLKKIKKNWEKRIILIVVLLTVLVLYGDIYATSRPISILQKKKQKVYMEKGDKRLVVIEKKNHLNYRSSNEKVISVNDQGVVQANHYGKARLIISSKLSKKRLYDGPIIVAKRIKRRKLATLRIPPNQQRRIDVKKMFKHCNIKKIRYTTNNNYNLHISSKGVVTTNNIIAPSKVKATYTDCFGHTIHQIIPIETVANGMIQKKELDRLHLEHVHKLMIVAHPDDESLWGGGHLIDGDYLVVTMTNREFGRRNREFFGVMHELHDQGMMLSYGDRSNLENGRAITWTPSMEQSIMKDISTLLSYKKWDLVVTHNVNGEYGHPHHKRLHHLARIVATKMCMNQQMYYFAPLCTKLEYDLLEHTHRLEPTLDSYTAQYKRDIMRKYYIRERKTIQKYNYCVPYENWTQEQFK